MKSQDTERAGWTPRAVCRRCRRPASVCYCSALTSIDTVTRIVILQHPRERDMAIGTARMATLCLPRASLHVGRDWDDEPALRVAVGDPSRPPILLYPGPGARDILTDPPAGPVTLIVVDGTWSQAKTIVRDNPVLAALPRYAFTAPEPTHYRIRREPRDDYVSTIEALMHVLGALEGDPARFRALLEPMHAMVEAQVACEVRFHKRRSRRPRPRRSPREDVPAAILERPGDLVCVVGEANAWPRSAGRADLPDELVHWVARRVATGETFDAVAAPRHELCPSTPSHTGLDEERLRRGAPRDDVVAAFARFVRPTDVICSWGWYAPRLFEQNGGALPGERIDLRLAARRLGRRKIGTLEQYAAQDAPPPANAPVGEGRARHRADMLVRIVESWRALPAV